MVAPETNQKFSFFLSVSGSKADPFKATRFANRFPLSVQRDRRLLLRRRVSQASRAVSNAVFSWKKQNGSHARSALMTADGIRSLRLT